MTPIVTKHDYGIDCIAPAPSVRYACNHLYIYVGRSWVNVSDSTFIFHLPRDIRTLTNRFTSPIHFRAGRSPVFGLFLLDGDIAVTEHDKR